MKKKIAISGVFWIFSITAFEIPNNELFRCNLKDVDVANQCDINEELSIFQKLAENEFIYDPIRQLEEWVDPIYSYPNIHPCHSKIVDTVKTLKVKSVLECGAGCGKVAKYIYAENPSLEIACVEHSSNHISQMHDNFENRTSVIKPDIKVKARIVQGTMPNLSMFNNASFDLVYTCTVMMHMPFIVNVCSAVEFSRITSRYILHVENRNLGAEWYDQVIVKPPQMSDVNYQAIDYQRIYENLGFKTLDYYQFKDPHSPAIYIYYLGEKIKK